MQDKKYHGLLLSLRVVVLDVGEARELYKNGFYGKPLGIEKPREPDFNAPLELSLLEALYLAEKNMLEIKDTSGQILGLEDIRSYAEKHIPRFKELYKVYKDLRDLGYVVRSGLKFGSDFAVYEYGPGIDHAPFLVHVMRAEDTIDPIEIVRAGRLSHSVRKRFIIALYKGEDTDISYIMFKWYKP